MINVYCRNCWWHGDSKELRLVEVGAYQWHTCPQCWAEADKVIGFCKEKTMLRCECGWRGDELAIYKNEPVCPKCLRSSWQHYFADDRNVDKLKCECGWMGKELEYFQGTLVCPRCLNHYSYIVEAVVDIIRSSAGDWNFCQFVLCPEDKLAKYHHTVGRGLRNDIPLWGESDVAEEFKSIGIWHADDMSDVLLTAVHRICNHKKVDITGLRKKYHAHWEKMGLDPWTGKEMADGVAGNT